jgi:hypothetical protein
MNRQNCTWLGKEHLVIVLAMRNDLCSIRLKVLTFVHLDMLRGGEATGTGLQEAPSSS